MNFLQILAGTCDGDFVAVLKIVRFVVSIISFAIPILLIILCILDISKIVTAGNIDDKLKKEVTNRIVTRIVFAVIIFLVPTIVRLLFRFVPIPDKNTGALNGVTWQDCWDQAGE